MTKSLMARLLERLRGGGDAAGPRGPLIPAPTKIRFFNTSTSAITIPETGGLLLHLDDDGGGVGTFGDAEASLYEDISIPGFDFADPMIGTAGSARIRPVDETGVDTGFRVVAVVLEGTVEGEPFSVRAELPVGLGSGDISIKEVVVLFTPEGNTMVRVTLRAGYLESTDARATRFFVCGDQQDVTIS